MTACARPPFDVELESALDAAPAFFTTLEPDSVAEFRAATTRSSSLDDIIAGRPVEVTDHTLTGHGGGEIRTVASARPASGGARGQVGLPDRCSDTMSTTDTAEPVTTSCVNIGSRGVSSSDARCPK